MPFDTRFYQSVEPLFVTGMGTEHIGPLLYTLVCMTRPRSVLEVGLGYTTPFLAQALKDAAEEDAADRTVLTQAPEDDQRRTVLRAKFFDRPYEPRLHAVDDYSDGDTSAPRVLETLKTLGLDHLVDVHRSDFRGFADRLDRTALPLDFVWFDAGGPLEYIDFLKEYWPLINPEHGHLLLHYTYWNITAGYRGREVSNLLCGSIANELKRQQIAAGFQARFEVASLVEPHKGRQGSVTLVRKLASTSMCRNGDFREEMAEIYGAKPPTMPVLR